MATIEYDPRKNRANLAKHGIDFETAARIWEGWVFERSDDRRDYREERIIALGAVEGRVVVAVYTWRGTRRRIISARKANGDERKIYATALTQSEGED
jgi:uncharacterized DUF497 family protein